MSASAIEAEFRESWHAIQGDGRFERAARRSLEASAREVPELAGVVAELLQVGQAELDLHLDGRGVEEHETDAERFVVFLSGIVDAVKESAKAHLGRQRRLSPLRIVAPSPGSVRVVLKAPPLPEMAGDSLDLEPQSSDSEALQEIAQALADANGPTLVPEKISNSVHQLPSKSVAPLRRAMETMAAAEWTICGELRRPTGEKLLLDVRPEGAQMLIDALLERDQNTAPVVIEGKLDGQRASKSKMWLLPDHGAAISATIEDSALFERVAALSLDAPRVRASLAKTTKTVIAQGRTASSYVLNSIEVLPSEEEPTAGKP